MKTQEVVPHPFPETGSALIQVGGSLVLIVILILLIAWLVKHFGFIARHTVTKDLKITASISLGTKERLVIVEVENARLLLGVTSQQISCLHTLPPNTTANDSPQETLARPFFDFASQLKKRLGKHHGSQ